MTSEQAASEAATPDGLFGPEAARNPYPFYARLRKESPVSRLGAMDFWLVAKHKDVTRMLRDWETFSSIVGAKAMAGEDVPGGMIFNDPPIHTRLRGLISKAFTPRVLEVQVPTIEANAADLIDKMLEHPDDTDIVAGLSYPLPVMVIAAMMGVADGDMATFKRWSDAIIENLGPALLMGDDSGLVDTNREFDAYFSERLEKLRREPEENLLSELVHVETEEGRLTLDELLMFCRLLLVAGNETTTGLFINTIRAFAEHPDALAEVRADLELVPSAIEESLRYYAPFAATFRRSTKDVKISGTTIPANNRILVLLASANRDEDVFERPEEFIVTRKSNKHMAFGLGIHGCVGAPLARLEAAIAFRILLPRITGVTLLDSDTGQMMRPGGPDSLRVRFDMVG